MDAQKGVDHIVFAGADMPHYDVPAHVAEHIYEERGVRTAPWRGIGSGATNFAIEVVIDELAELAGRNPLEYRLALLKDPRAKRVIEKSAEMAEWTRKRDGTALGIAFGKLGLPPVGFSWSPRRRRFRSIGRAGVFAVTISGVPPMSGCRCSRPTWWRSSRAR